MTGDGVIALAHYGLEVPDVDEGRAFYETFGLVAIGAHDGDGVAMAAAGRDGPQVVLRRGDAKRLAHLSFVADPASLAAVHRRARDAGAVVSAGDEGVWIEDPDGNRSWVRVGEVAPWRRDGTVPVNGPAGADRVGQSVPAPPRPVRPRRLGHVLLFSPQIERQVAFYVDILGMRVSDYGGDAIAFLHCAAPLTDHHTVAFLRGDRPGWHHAAFEVASVDEIVAGAGQCAAAGWREGWGLGRHAVGSNLFHYVRDPWGSFAEYFTDIDVIDTTAPWKPTVHDEAVALYRWGPDVPTDFATNTDGSR